MYDISRCNLQFLNDEEKIPMTYDDDKKKTPMTDDEEEKTPSIPEKTTQRAVRKQKTPKRMALSTDHVWQCLKNSTLLDKLPEGVLVNTLYPLRSTEKEMWRIKELELGFAFKCSITSNVIEGMNRLYKEATEWKELSLDRLLLVLNKLQGYFINKCQRTYYILGEFELRSEYYQLKVINVLCVLGTLLSYDSRRTVAEIKEAEEANDRQETHRPKPISTVALSKILFPDTAGTSSGQAPKTVLPVKKNRAAKVSIQ
ncbi:unnamed protein product [Didymodactylos carnosus]|uniref:Uncharacterized protein n=1 Tax=Didymodactylos carnosus TaxID=1234261 RepID=A0A814DP61_9BILA|nr:unnamed protein product [Didymodactylos carnosus]CAF3735603.1 unnamed protein product [Didymodactylos carnosus]